MPSPSDIDALRSQLAEAQKAQQTAEVALAHEREANIAEGVRTMIDNAAHERADARRERDRMRQARDQAQAALEQAQRTVWYLERRVARLTGENRCPQLKASQLTVVNSRFRYLASGSKPTRHTHQRPTRINSPVTPMLPLRNITPRPLSMMNPTVFAQSDPEISPSTPQYSPLVGNRYSLLPRQPRETLGDALSADSPTEDLSDIGTYTLLGRLEAGIRIGANGIENPADMHAYLWRDELRRLQDLASDATQSSLYGCANDHIDAILCRQGRYAELVAALFPDAPQDPTLDPADSTLEPESLMDVLLLARGDTIHEEDVVRWMYAVLNVSREAARLELEPYFRRRAHYYLAVQAWRDTLTRGAISPNARTSMSLYGSRSELERCFHAFRPFDYPVHSTTLFVATGSNVVAWVFPDNDSDIEDVAVDFSWLPNCITHEVVARYRELCIASDV